MPKRSEIRAPREELRLVAFDMDGVLIDHVSSWAAIHDFLGTDNREAVRAFLEGRIDDRQFILEDVRLWREAQPDFDRAAMRRILRRVPRMPGFLEAIASVRSHGAQVAIISGGLREMAQILAAEADIQLVHANDVVFGADGRLQDDAVVDVPLRDKGSVLQAVQRARGIAPSQTASVGDSHFDVGLFENSAVSVAFNPMDEPAAAGATHVVKSKDLRQAVQRILEGARDSG